MEVTYAWIKGQIEKHRAEQIKPSDRHHSIAAGAPL
jgi:hypothetical protein